MIKNKMNNTVPDTTTFSAQNVTELLRQFELFLKQQNVNLSNAVDEQNEYIKTHAIQGEAGGFKVGRNYHYLTGFTKSSDYIYTLNDAPVLPQCVLYFGNVGISIRPTGSGTLYPFRAVSNLIAFSDSQEVFRVDLCNDMVSPTAGDSVGVYYLLIMYIGSQWDFQVIDRYGNAIPTSSYELYNMQLYYDETVEV